MNTITQLLDFQGFGQSGNISPECEKCLKRPFSKREARTVLNFILGKGRRRKYRREARYYHCPTCNHWHLTSKMKFQVS